MGKSLGGIVGAVLENQKQWHELTIEQLWPDRLYPNDDLDIQLVWLEALQERGLYLTHRDLAEYWQDRCWYNFCEYGQFLHNLQRGIAPPWSGVWNNRFFFESEGCPIRSEIWGFVAPGCPALAAEMARLDGELDHGGLSVEIEMFNAAAAAQAFVTADLNEVLAAGLSVVSPASRLHGVVARVRALCERERDPRRLWRILMRHYGDRDASKAVTNFVIVLMGLLLGHGDFKKTMWLCVSSGWDTDCTAATAGALLGVMGGTAALPGDWVGRMGRNLTCAIKVRHHGASLASLAEDTCRIGVEMSATRNREVSFSGAPSVPVRPPPEPTLSMEVAYREAPVLWSERPTVAQVIVRNPHDGPARGRLVVEAAPGTEVVGGGAMEVAARSAAEVFITARRQERGQWLPDKNLFCVVWEGKDGLRLRRVFGLGGARQWLLYGPYWHMWDKEKYPVCPYNSGGKMTQVWSVPGCAGDSYNQYAYLDHAYLDEQALLQGELATESPMLLEAGEDLLDTEQWGGFRGQACYYLTRTIRLTEGGPRSANLMIGRSGPCRVWLDGKEIYCADGMRQWTSQEQAGQIVLTGAPQRLVVKLVRWTDDFRFLLAIGGGGDPEQKRGISWLLDTLADRITPPTA